MVSRHYHHRLGTQIGSKLAGNPCQLHSNLLQLAKAARRLRQLVQMELRPLHSLLVQRENPRCHFLNAVYVRHVTCPFLYNE
ncbi:hypothetical protein D3C75_1157000 [compost metagenome]